jgi:hypothetical protein
LCTVSKRKASVGSGVVIRVLDAAVSARILADAAD